MSEDGADMQAAFQAFMMGGGKEQLSTPAKSPQVSASSSKAHLAGGSQQAWKKAERKYWQILHAFQSVLQNRWLEADDNLGSVIDSIANLRMRIGMESRKLREIEGENKKEWMGYGFRVRVGLKKEDVDMALSHDLLQHERMMVGARTLLAAMADAQEMLGRRLEEMMLFHMDAMESTREEIVNSNEMWMLTVERLQQVFRMLASELFRKQKMVQQVLDSACDDLLEDDRDATEKTGREIVDECSAKWSRSGRASAVDEQMVQNLLDLGDFRGEHN